MLNLRELEQKVMEQIDLSRPTADEEVWEVIEATLKAAASSSYISLSERVRAGKEIFNSLRKLDILQDLLDDPSVTEIMINGTDNIFFEKEGRLRKWEKKFDSRSKLEDVIQQIVSGSNRMVNEREPIADARLADGSRVNVVLHPVALNGPAVTIRKFPDDPMTMEKLVRIGSVSEEADQFLKKLVASGYNIFISGGTGSGKTTFLNALSDYIPPDERVIIIEDNAELQIKNLANLVYMETRNANVEGCNPISIRDLIKTSLRMRPTRIIVGEVRGPEAVDMLQGMNTGHDGSFSTGHANSPRDMLSRLETMVLMGMDIPLEAVRRQIASAVDIIIHLGRLRDKSRKVLEITEIRGYGRSEIILNTIYKFEERGEDENGRIKGTLEKKGGLCSRRKLEEAGHVL